ncbi:hypothetical protein [Spirosoma utsteinense]|uniref:Uncharacterized protein n=1 Tax=Spirosoma utsteinense TaxID=2585773 RepID=A0ABR6W2R3_9BACT|nr:hypothetical protein [Spirosoma utsteinense]MBC3783675.1 hypothetical protein [Spirosoma utsteinense]MBC3790182.1 hypothetical protein [Spirosoma utsteinense]
MAQQLTAALNLTKQYIDRLAQSQEPTGAQAPDNAQAQLLEEIPVRSSQPQPDPVLILANEYLKQTGLWLKAEKQLLGRAGRQQLLEVRLGLRTELEVMPILYALKDAWEMIRWYRTLIPVKTQAALRSLTEPTNDPYFAVYYLGKAKLVLVSIDQSLRAWETILHHFPEKADDLLDLMAMLSRMSREMDVLFPQARAFQRPGLD